MSLIDILAILLIICLCYIGYLKGIKGKTFFLSSFAISSILMYFIFGKLLFKIVEGFSSFIFSGFIAIGFIFVPIFVFIEFILRKSLIDEKVKSFSNSKKHITNASKVTGALMGFLGGYTFVCGIFIFEIHSHDYNQKEVPEFLENSFFYKMGVKTKKEISIDIINQEPEIDKKQEAL